MHTLTFKHALTPLGIVEDCRVEVDDAGCIASIGQGGPPYDGHLALPGMPNAHSHAFQRALAGHGERRAGEDSFWSWREAMYGLAGRITPEQYHAVACQAYAEMLAAGFTAVAEFHYLHHLPDGTPGMHMADAVIAAANDTGIRLRMMPVYYHGGGFGEPASPAQARFVHADVDAFLALVDALDHPDVGIAAHSLRAVPLDHLRELTRYPAPGTRHRPCHIHISEQQAEVEACIAAHGRRPVELLADTVDLDMHWTLVHATHTDKDERRRIAGSGATVSVCPLTEAYLGDGLFDAVDFNEAGGQMAVGSDSNVRIDAIEELRWLEYGQRLRDMRRARLADAEGIGTALWSHAAAAGAMACGLKGGALRVGAFADIVVLDGEAMPFAGLATARWPDAWLTGGSRDDIACTYVGGQRIVERGRHHGADGIREAFARAMMAIHA